MKEAEPIKSNIVFTGNVTDDEKIKLITKSSFVVFPSIVEGFGFSIIEGFACGKPVLVSDVKPSSDIVKNNYTGFLIPPFDIEQWACRMIDLLSNVQKQKQMGKNSYQEFVSNYELKIMVNATEKFYENLILRSKGRS